MPSWGSRLPVASPYRRVRRSARGGLETIPGRRPGVMARALLRRVGMGRKKTGERKRAPSSKAASSDLSSAIPPEQELGPPARETIVMRSDREREAEERLAEHHATSP